MYVSRVVEIYKIHVFHLTNYSSQPRLHVPALRRTLISKSQEKEEGNTTKFATRRETRTKVIAAYASAIVFMPGEDRLD
jgi:hypothetical protein